MPARRFALLVAAALLAPVQATRAGEAGIIEWPEGGSYTGALLHGRPHGEGVEVRPDGSRYSGDWRDGVRDGFGTLVFPDGRRYVGRFRRGRATGEGGLISPMGTRYRARLGPNGAVLPGAMMGAPQQTAEKPDSLEAWLRGP